MVTSVHHPGGGTIRRPHVALAELGGYVGGALTAAGAFLVLAEHWRDLASGTRILLAGATALALLAAAVIVADDSQASRRRLRAVLWLLGTAAATTTTALIVHDVLAIRGSRPVASLIAATTAVVGAAGWRARARAPEAVVALGAGYVALGSAVSELLGDVVAGLTLVMVAIALLWPVLVGGIDPPVATAVPSMVGGLAGALLLAEPVPAVGLPLGTSWAVALAWIALAPDRVGPVRIEDPSTAHRVRVASGTVALLAFPQIVPPTIAHFAHDAALTTGLVVSLVGCLALSVASASRIPSLVRVLGSLTLLGGAALTGVQYARLGSILLVGAALALTTHALAGRRSSELVPALLGLVTGFPWALDRWFGDALAVPIAIVAIGLAMLLVAALAIRRRPPA
ncbi:MAG: hypothetical protein R2715_22880 [Ilumatobacteraceae bacterium]